MSCNGWRNRRCFSINSNPSLHMIHIGCTLAQRKKCKSLNFGFQSRNRVSFMIARTSYFVSHCSARPRGRDADDTRCLACCASLETRESRALAEATAAHPCFSDAFCTELAKACADQIRSLSMTWDAPKKVGLNTVNSKHMR